MSRIWNNFLTVGYLKPFRRRSASEKHSRTFVLILVICVEFCIGSFYSWALITNSLTTRYHDSSHEHESWAVIGPQQILTVAIIMQGFCSIFLSKKIGKQIPLHSAIWHSAWLYGIGLISLATMLIDDEESPMCSPFLVIPLGAVPVGLGIGIAFVACARLLHEWYPENPTFSISVTLFSFAAGSIFGGLIWESNKSMPSQLLAIWGLISFIIMLIASFGLLSPSSAFIQKRRIELQRRRSEAANKHSSLHEKPMLRGQKVTKAAKCTIVMKQVILLPQFYCIIVPYFIGSLAHHYLLLGFTDFIFVKGTAWARQGVFACAMLSTALGRLSFTHLSDTLGRKNTFMVLNCANTLLLAVMGMLGRNWFVISLVLAFSLQGGNFHLLPVLLSETFGPANLKNIHALGLSAWPLSVLSAGLLLVFVRSSDPSTPLIVLACLSFLAAGLIIMLKPVTPAQARQLNRKHLESDMEDVRSELTRDIES